MVLYTYLELFYVILLLSKIILMHICSIKYNENINSAANTNYTVQALF